MSTVFLVYHERRVPLPADLKLIGAYTSSVAAEGAIARLSEQPGFRELPEGFSVSELPLDRDHWREGYGVPHEDDLAGLKPPPVSCAICTATITPTGDDPAELFVRGAVTDTEQGLYAHGACLRGAIAPSVPLLLMLPMERA